MLGLLALFGVLLILTLTQSRRPLSGKTWTYLRCLFPSWRFFEDVEPGPELQVCVEDGSTERTWHPVLPLAERAHLFLNHRGNLRLAYQSLVEQLASDLDGVSVASAPALVTYRLVQRLVRDKVRAMRVPATAASYRFRLCQSGEVVFESESHAL